MVRTADAPGQTLNVDLLFVPSCHLADMKLPAVSGSSGHLVVERLQEAGQEKQYPGRVFENTDLDYEEVVKAFVDASKPFDRRKKNITEPAQTKIQLLRQEEIRWSNDRREIRNQRILEDAEWKLIWEQHRDERKSNRFGQPRPHASWGVSKQKDEERKKLRKHRRAQMKQRDRQDEKWRLARINWREKVDLLPVVTAWTAILLVTDNCSRQCLGLPFFVAGSHVTSEMVVAALRILLPTNLKFIISDRGSHFSSKSFTQFATEANFLHVLIARHRPQSNGIAERFVRTIEEWLADKAWSAEEDLSEYLRQFLLEYNDRPHQGLPFSGLSPNEYANRIWLM